MSGTTPVGTWLETNYNTMTGTQYPLQIDSNMAVAQRFVADFAPSPQANPNMTLLVAAGHIFTGTALTEKAAQTTTSFTAPASGYTRIDRVVINRITGTYSVITGTPTTGTPSAPAITAGNAPCAQILFSSTSTAIIASMITDERDVSLMGSPSENTISLASASTTDLGTALSYNVKITGTTTINSLGSSASTEAPFYFVTFGAALTLTYNATSLILPSSANITTAANDFAIFQYLGSGNWQCLSYYPSSGKALVSPTIPTSVVTVHSQEFTSSGTYTPTTGMLYCIAEVLGGGGGGGAGNGSDYSASGGGAGGYAKKVITASTIGSSQTITIGSGGTAATSGSPTGGTGGTSSLGSIISCAGGVGGVNGGGVYAVGGAGGTATGGDINATGAQGGIAFNSGTGISGYGADTLYGGGGAARTGGAESNGHNATGYGAGGGATYGSGYTSGTGAPGIIYITEFCSQ